MTYLKKKKDSINFDVISSSFNNVVSSMLDHVEIFHDSPITVVILTFEQRNGTLQAIYVLDYLLFVILKQVKSWCFSSCCLRTWRNDSIDHFCFVFFRWRIDVRIWSRIGISWWYNFSLSLWSWKLYWFYGSFKKTWPSWFFLFQWFQKINRFNQIFLGFVISRFNVNIKFDNKWTRKWSSISKESNSTIESSPNQRPRFRHMFWLWTNGSINRLSNVDMYKKVSSKMY